MKAFRKSELLRTLLLQEQYTKCHSHCSGIRKKKSTSLISRVVKIIKKTEILSTKFKYISQPNELMFERFTPKSSGQANFQDVTGGVCKAQ